MEPQDWAVLDLPASTLTLAYTVHFPHLLHSLYVFTFKPYLIQVTYSLSLSFVPQPDQLYPFGEGIDWCDCLCYVALSCVCVHVCMSAAVCLCVYVSVSGRGCRCPWSPEYSILCGAGVLGCEQPGVSAGNKLRFSRRAAILDTAEPSSLGPHYLFYKAAG